MTTYDHVENKTVMVTGATSGIGMAVTQQLTDLGATVIGVGRSLEACQRTRRAIQNGHQQDQVSFQRADLSSQRQICALADRVKEKYHKVDVLINNAGTFTNWYESTEDGYETQFAVNHLAPFLLTLELLPLLQAAPAARVLTVSSKSHRGTSIQWGNVMLRRKYKPLLAYKQSKLANILFTREFNRRFGENAGVRAFAIDPGLVNTNIGLKHSNGIARWVWEKRSARGISPQESAANIVFVALDASVDEAEADYWKNRKPAKTSRYARREYEAAKLWALSERLCGLSN